MEHVIMANPISGRGKGKTNALIVQKLLKKYGIDSIIKVSNYEGELNEIAKKLSGISPTRFYSIGGDGTLNEIASGIVNTSSDVVVLPCGTGNDFIKCVSDYFSLRKIILTSLDKKSTSFDIIKINNNRYCLNILNAGFDAMVAKNIKYFRWIPLLSGKAKYNLSIFFTLIKNRNYMLRIKTNSDTVYSNYTLVAISNGKYYGGGIVPSPNANPKDSKLSICMVAATSILTKIFLLPKYKSCKHLNFKQVNINDNIESISIVSNKKFPLSIDGEVIYTNRIKGKILKNAINIVETKKES